MLLPNESGLNETVHSLLDFRSQESAAVAYAPHPLPTVEALKHLVELSRHLLFPGFFSAVTSASLPHLTGINMERLFKIATEQIHLALAYEWEAADANLRTRATELSLRFVESLPEIRRKLLTDVKAIFAADPSAKSFGEIILCYPSVRAMINHRLAHQLAQLDIPLLPRMIAEIAHSETGIDIHPKAQIGNYFCIDHGTGVVIGETCIIGDYVRLYQGVTLGAKRFTLDDNGHALKDEPRHPIIQDNVVIYSNATILGRIVIGANSVIGGNVWITSDLPPHSKITQARVIADTFQEGLGI